MPNLRYRKMLKSLFLDDMEPEDLAVEMNIPESQLKLLKKKAVKELKNVIFKKKS